MIIIISGEQYQAHEYLEELKRDAQEKGFEYYRFDEEADVAQRVSDLVSARTLFAREKFIVIHAVSFEVIKEMCQELHNRVGENALVFFAPTGRTMKLASKDMSHKHFEMPTGAELDSWIKKQWDGYGGEARSYLQSIAGQFSSLFPLKNEIEKMRLAKRQHHTQLYAFGKPDSAFALTDGFLARDMKKTLTALETQLQAGEKPFDIISRIVWQTRVLVLVQDHTLNPKLSTLSLHPFVVKKAQQALRFFTGREVNDLFLKTISLYEKILFSGGLFSAGLFSSLSSEILLSLFFLDFSRESSPLL